MYMKKLHLLVFAMFTTICSCLFAQDNLVEYLKREKGPKKEKGLITNDGCKILVKRYYGLSEDRYYFRVKGDKTFYFLDTTEVNCIEGIKIGKNKELANEKYPGFKRGLWLGTCILLGPICAIGVAGSVALFIYSDYSNPTSLAVGSFFTLLPIDTFIFYRVTRDAYKNLKLVKAFKTGKPFVCLK